MKIVSLVLIIGAVMQIALSAPTADVPTTIKTPLGSMDMDQLVEHYRKFTTHIIDDKAPDTVELIKTLLKEIDGFISNTGNSSAETKTYQEFRSAFADYLKDIEVDMSECGFEDVSEYHYNLIIDIVKKVDNVKVKLLWKLFRIDQLQSIGDSGSPMRNNHHLEFITDDKLLHNKIYENSKSSTKCCKYVEKYLQKNKINGSC